LKTEKQSVAFGLKKLGVSVSNQKLLGRNIYFYNEKMNALELFYSEYDDFIKDIVEKTDFMSFVFVTRLHILYSSLIKRLLNKFPLFNNQSSFYKTTTEYFRVFFY
jgi:hypothetical protein